MGKVATAQFSISDACAWISNKEAWCVWSPNMPLQSSLQMHLYFFYESVAAKHVKPAYQIMDGLRNMPCLFCGPGRGCRSLSLV